VERLTWLEERPEPERATVCGLPEASSATLSEAERLPLAAGVNVTLIVQLPFAATELPHALVCAKSPAFVPVTEMLVRVKLAFPVLVRVTDWAGLATPTDWLPKERPRGERVTSGPALMPVPERLTVCGLPLALSAMLTSAVRVPPAEGVKVTLIVQSAPAATELPQLFVSAKSLALVPVTVRLVMLKVEVPVLDRVTDWGLLGFARD
jgi:hypothetical protein